MSDIIPTNYAYETLEYLKKARKLQDSGATFGKIQASEVGINDPLMENIPIYDVVKRKYAGFNRVLLMMHHGTGDQNKFYEFDKPELKAKAVTFGNGCSNYTLADWCFVYVVHRVTGSGINYGDTPSGYRNSPLLHFNPHDNIDSMVDTIKTLCENDTPIFTSGGYQIQPFKTENSLKPGQNYIFNHAPIIAKRLANYLVEGGKKDLLSILDHLNEYNTSNGMKRFNFAYAAVAADIADFHPEYVNRYSDFVAGTNAFQCMSLQFDKKKNMNKLKFVNQALEWLCENDAKSHDQEMLTKYDIEDTGGCDVIRYLENYVPNSENYAHLDLNVIFNNSSIVKDHPYGRQKAMLDHDKITDFNQYSNFSYDKMLKVADMTAEEYKEMLT